MDYIISRDFDGKTRKLYLKILDCGHQRYLPKNRNYRACSVKCRGTLNSKKVKTTCAFCSSDIMVYQNSNSRSGLRFCNRRCKERGQSLEGGIVQIQPDHYGTNDSISHYRERAMRHYGPACAKCGYEQDERMLDVDHVDHNRRNNKINNLQVLCVWCHALKTRTQENWGHSLSGKTQILHI